MHRQTLAAVIAGACVLAAFIVLLLEVPLSGARAPGIVERFAAFGVGVGVAYGVLAAALLAVRPGHPLIRWWLAIAGLAWVATLSGSLGLLGVWVGWPVPAPEVLIWVGGWSWVPVYWLIPTAIFALSPDGHLPSVRWRPFFWLVGVVIAMTTVGWMMLPADEIDGPALLADGAQWPVSGWVWAPVLVVVGSALGMLAVIVALAAVVARYRSATVVDRARLRWLVLGAAGTLTLLAAALALPPSGGVLLTMAVAPFPLSVCAAVLGAGLWDIDALVSRTLVYSGLLVSVSVVYVASVVLLGQLLGQVPGAPLAATLVVAVVVVPLKARLERSANRIVHGQREDPHATLAALVVRLDAAAHAEDAVTSSLETLVETLPLRGASVVAGSASWMAGEVEEPATTFELALRGATLGRLSVQPLPGVRLGRSARSTLQAVAGRLALIVHSEEITDELLRSRARLVAARDEERHRISVDLHDGIGPSLAALGLQTHRAHDLVHRDPDAAQRALEGMAEEIRRTVADVRAIVAGMAPGELETNGLAASLPALIERFDSPAMAVELTCDLSPGDELPVGVEIAAYNVVAEALANAVAHSGAGRCSVAVSRNGRLEIDVVDDGNGFPSSLVPGIGIASMRRRVEACGGSFTIRKDPAGGTMVRASLPVTG